MPTPSESPVSEAMLVANQARWSASAIDRYRYRFRWECFCGHDEVRTVDITVARGTIVSVVDVETGQRLDAQAASRYRTIEGLFEFVRGAIDYPAVSVNGAFDPDLGIPWSAHVDYVANIADEEKGFRIFALTRFPGLL